MNGYVLITGAAGGLGKAFAAECASRGWDLFLTDLPDAALEPLAAGVQRMYGIQVHYHSCDLTDPDSRDALWEHIGQQGLRFHTLLNVAGTEFEGPFAGRTPSELRTILRLNDEATVEMTWRVLPHRVPDESLTIINVSSLAAYFPIPMKAVYTASKRFIVEFSRALRDELRPENVRVMAVCPSGMPTNPRCIKGFEEQGFLGRLSVVNVGPVAARSLDLARAGRAVYVPGLINRFLRLHDRLAPAPLVSTVLSRRWRRRYAAQGLAAKTGGTEPGVVTMLPNPSRRTETV